MNVYELTVLAFGFAATVLSLWALIVSYAARAIEPENGVITVERQLTEQRLQKAERELFRQGQYPDLGLRAWCREWRSKLRSQVSGLESRVYRLEHPVDAPTPPFTAEPPALTARPLIGYEDWDNRDARINALEARYQRLLDHLKLAEQEKLIPVVAEPQYAAVTVLAKKRRG